MSNPWDVNTDVTRLPVGYTRDLIKITDADLSDAVDNVGNDFKSGKPNIAVGLYVEVAGTVVFKNVDGNTRTVAVAANSYIICSIKRVMETGTGTGLGIHAIIA